jgi:hypothetical protein
VCTALYEPRQNWELTRIEEGAEDLPIHSVPADYQYTLRHFGRLLDLLLTFTTELGEPMSA